MIVVDHVTRFIWQIDGFLECASPDGPNAVLFSNAFLLHGTNIEFRLEFSPTNFDSHTHSSIHVRSRALDEGTYSIVHYKFWVENIRGDSICPAQNGMFLELFVN
jgi:hypothetical protein